jgi:hypothetical protein
MIYFSCVITEVTRDDLFRFGEKAQNLLKFEPVELHQYCSYQYQTEMVYVLGILSLISL